MDRERIVQIFFFGFLLVMGYELYILLSPFLTPIVWAILLAFIAHPALVAVNRIVKNRSLSAVIMTAALVLVVIIPAIWLSGRLATEAQTLLVQVEALIKQGTGLSKVRDWAVHSEVVRTLLNRLGGRTARVDEELSKMTLQTAQATSNYVLTNVGTVAKNLVTGIIDFGIILLTFFYLLRDGESYYESLLNLTPLHEDDKRVVFETLSSTLSGVMRGLMLTSLLQGVTIGLGLLIFGVPYWAFLAIVTAFAGLLPLGGTVLVWVPAALYLLYSVGWTPAIGLVVWCAIAVAIIDNFLKPMAMRHGTNLPTLLLFFGIAGGLEAYGPVGMFAGPAIISVFAALLEVYRKTYGAAPRKRHDRIVR